MGRIGYYLGWFALGCLVGWAGIATVAWWLRLAIRLAARYRRRYLRRQLIQVGGLERVRLLLACYEATGELPVSLVALLPHPWDARETHRLLLGVVTELEEEAFRME